MFCLVTTSDGVIDVTSSSIDYFDEIPSALCSSGQCQNGGGCSFFQGDDRGVFPECRCSNPWIGQFCNETNPAGTSLTVRYVVHGQVRRSRSGTSLTVRYVAHGQVHRFRAVNAFIGIAIRHERVHI